MSKKFNIVDVNDGFYRITYATRDDKNQKIYYCLQVESDSNLEFLRCTADGEPSYPCTLKKPAIELLELPQGDSELEKLCASWITNHQPLNTEA